MFRPATTEAAKNRAALRVRVPRRTRSSRWSAFTTNLRMLTFQCSRVMSGITTCSREPSGNVASTILRYHLHMPAIIYARISQDRQKDGAGVERQIQDCTALAARMNLDVVEVIKENDTSAYRLWKTRPGWERIMALANAGEVDGIVVWHTDRLYRHPMDLEKLALAVEDTGLTIYTCTAGE